MIVMLLIFALTAADTTHHHQKDSARSHMTISQVLEKYTLPWMQMEGVIGTGEGEKNGKPCVLILVKKKTPGLMKQLPKSVEGYPVVLKEVGAVKALKRR